MKRAICLLFLIFLLLPNSSRAAGGSYALPGNVVRFERLSSTDGLSQNAGLVIFQDSRGYLWFGTQDGLNRYDGYAFKIFKHDPDDANSISYNSILAMEEDRAGFLWIGTWGGGLNRFDPVTESFVRYRHDPENSRSLSNDTVTGITLDSQGNLWVATLDGLNRLNANTNDFEHFTNDPKNTDSLSSNVISFIYEDLNNQLWIGTGAQGVEGAGLNRFDPQTGKAVRFQHDEKNPQSLSSNTLSSIYEAADGTFWLGTGGFSLSGNGLNHFDPQTGKARRYSKNSNDPNSLAGDDVMTLVGDGETLWIGTWTDGLSRMDFSNPGHFENYKHDPYFSDSLSGDEVWSLFKDRSGILWIGTSHNGINKLAANTGQFSLYRNIPGNPDSLVANAVGSFAEDSSGNIWVATWGNGLDFFDIRTGKFTHYRNNPEDPQTISADLLMAVHVDFRGNVWAGTLGTGLNRLDPATNKFTHYLHDPQNAASLADDNTAAMISDGQGGLWIATFGGLSHYDARKDSFINYVSDEANPTSLSHNTVVSLFIDSTNNLWVGTWGGGLNQLDLNDPRSTDPRRAVFTRYVNDPKDSSTISENSVWTIHKTKDDFLWLGTQIGLNRFDPKSKTFKHYTEKHGLPNNTVLGILEDERGNLWLTTNNGLAQFNPREETFSVYDVSDGLQSSEFNSNAYYRAKNSAMYIGGNSGFNIFHPEDIKPNPVAPQVVINKVEVYNQPLQADLSGNTPIRLSYDQNLLSFEFTALDFQAPQKNQYAYKLEGFDEDWIQADNRRYVTYTNLPGGSYVFQVKAANSDGVWNEAGAALPIIITPPFWQTWWFVAAAVITLGALITSAYRWRMNSIREQNFNLEIEIAKRTTELRETNRLLEKEVEQRKRAEEELARRAASELHDSEARFRAMYHNAAVGMAMMSLDRKILSINQTAATMTGYTLEELYNTDPTRLSHPDDIPIGREEFIAMVAGKLPGFQIEKRFLRKNGEIFWGRVTYSVVPDKDGYPEYLVGIIEDATEQRAAKARLAEQEAEYRRTLEQRVEERTYELAEANQRLLDEIDQRKRAEEALALKAAEDAVTAERTRLARDLHDAVSQTLFSASIVAEILPELWQTDMDEAKRSTAELSQLTRGALAEMRTLLLELRPAALTQARLNDLIRQLCEALVGRARLPIKFTSEGEKTLPPEVQVAFYRIAQESLNNVFKYARATQVNVGLFLTPAGAHLEVCDNGIGFDMSVAKPTSLGMRIMRERAEAIGAELIIQSKPGEGVCLDLTWTEKPGLKLSVFKS